MPPTTLHIFDFDGTLFLSPMAPEWWEDESWWSNPASLLPPIVPKRPPASWWDRRMVESVKRSSTGYNVLLSARIGKPEITRRVTDLVTQQGLRFQQIILKPDGEEQRSAEWKAEEFKRLLGQTNATSAVLYDDDYRNVEALAYVAMAYGIRFRVVHGSGLSSPVACTREEYIAMTPRTGKTARLVTAAPVYVFHGTASGEGDVLLKRILKEGLNPEPKHRTFTDPTEDTDDYYVQQKMEITTYGGVYFAYNADTVSKYMLMAKEKVGGDRVLVIARVETRSPATAMDEDVFGKIRDNMLEAYVRSEHNAVLNTWLALEYLKDPSFSWTDAAAWTLADVKKTYQLQLKPQQEASVIADLAKLIKLNALYHVAREIPGSWSSTRYDWEKLDTPVKDVKQLMAMYRAEHDRFTRRFKALVARPTNFYGKFHSFRFLDPVGYSGANRIVAVVRFEEPDSPPAPYHYEAQVLYSTADAEAPLKQAIEAFIQLWSPYMRWTTKGGTELYAVPNPDATVSERAAKGSKQMKKTATSGRTAAWPFGKNKLPKQFVVDASCLADTFGLSGGSGTVGFELEGKTWVVSYGGKREPSPFTTADVAKAYSSCNAKKAAAAKQLENSPVHEFTAAPTRCMRAETADLAKLQEAVKLLQSVDFGQDPTKGLPVLEQARGLVLEGGVQPTDIELAIRSWSEPNGSDKAKGFIYGPSGRGSNKGAITDLSAIIEKSKTSAEK